MKRRNNKSRLMKVGRGMISKSYTLFFDKKPSVDSFSILIKASRNFSSSLILEYNEKQANLKSALELLHLELCAQSKVILKASGTDAYSAILRMESIIEDYYSYKDYQKNKNKKEVR